MVKHCSNCVSDKPLDDFGRDKNRKDGRYPVCRACVRAKYHENIEEHRRRDSERYYRDPEGRILRQNREKYRTDSEYRNTVLARNRLYQDSHKEERRAYYASYVRERKRNDPNFKAVCLARWHIWRACSGYSKGSRTEAILGCSFEDFKKHIESKFLPGMTWGNHGEWHIDHIRPLASFDLTNDSERAAASHYTNLQPLWKLDNLRKGARYEVG